MEVDVLTKQLLAQPSTTKIEPAEDFSVDLGSEGWRVGFWKFKNGVKLKKEKMKMNLSEPKTENSNVPSMIFAIMSQTLAPISGLIFGYIPVRDHSFVIFVKKILSVKTIARNTC